MKAPASDDPSGGRRKSAYTFARELERDAEVYPDERTEILLEAARQYCRAGEHQRALEIYDDLIATAAAEDTQWATVSRLDVLADLGRTQDVEREIARLRRDRIASGPAGMVAEFLEEQGRLEQALDWFNLACHDLLASDDPQFDGSTLMARTELQGRARVRRALGLPPDEFDDRVEREHAGMVDRLDLLGRRLAGERPTPAAGFFVRGDVARAFAEGLVHVDDPTDDDVDSYYRRCERSWRVTVRDHGSASQVLLPTTVDDVLAYAAEHGRDPHDQETRSDHLTQRLREGAATLVWPPERNAPCWCGSNRKYKKCCGAASNK